MKRIALHTLAGQVVTFRVDELSNRHSSPSGGTILYIGNEDRVVRESMAEIDALIHNLP